MSMRWGGVLMAAASLSAGLQAQVHRATGIVIASENAGKTLVVSCDEIPGYMAAMEMSFRVEGAGVAVRPGLPIAFVMEERKHVLYAREIHVVPGASLESEPMQAGGLGALQQALQPSAGAQVLPQGARVPDFALTDQAGQTVRLSGLAGKVVVLTFGYSRCPNPEYCFRLSNNLSRVRGRFAARMPRDLVLLTVAIDPEHDQGAALAEYAAVWKAQASSWHFLTSAGDQGSGGDVWDELLARGGAADALAAHGGH